MSHAKTTAAQPLPRTGETILVNAVKEQLAQCLRSCDQIPDHLAQNVMAKPGKMLRTKFLARLCPVPDNGHVAACAAIELVHTASLFHDDVIDNASLRRGQPAFWKRAGTRGAILAGDLLFMEALRLVLQSPASPLAEPFVEKVRETCAAETEQELMLAGKDLDEDTCIRLVRRKTGSLFAFLGQASGNGNPELSSVLEEVGYRVGTAYQIADDLLDVLGHEEDTGKTVGTDFERSKFTIASLAGIGKPYILQKVRDVVMSARDLLKDFPEHRQGLMDYFAHDIQPVLQKQGLQVDFGTT